MHEARETRGHRAVLDAGQSGGLAQFLWQQGEEQPRAHPGLEHAAGSKAEMPCGAPQGADDRLRRVVRILGRALQRCIFGRTDRLGQFAADRLPAGPKIGAPRQWEAALRQLRGAEANEPEEPCLLFGCRRATALFELFGEPDRCEVVARPRGPAAGEAAVGFEVEVSAPHRRHGPVSDAFRVGLARSCGGWLGFRSWPIDGPAKSGAVEEAERVLRGVGHRRVLLYAGAPPRCQARQAGGVDRGVLESSGRLRERMSRGRGSPARASAQADRI